LDGVADIFMKQEWACGGSLARKPMPRDAKFVGKIHRDLIGFAVEIPRIWHSMGTEARS
jgi:hypothetical protein